MTTQVFHPAGDFRTSYAADTTIFPTVAGRNVAIATVFALCIAPIVLSQYWLSILIQIGYLAVAALGLQILLGASGQISVGHAAFFGFGPLASGYLRMPPSIPVFFS